MSDTTTTITDAGIADTAVADAAVADAAAPAPQRLFRYGEHAFDDPGPQYSPDQVRSHLTAYFPELGQATAHETALPDGMVEITFRKQVTTKGSDGRAR